MPISRNINLMARLWKHRKHAGLACASAVACATALSVRPAAAAVPDCSSFSISQAVTAGQGMVMSGQVLLQVGDTVVMTLSNTGGTAFLTIFNSGQQTSGIAPTTLSLSASLAGSTTVKGEITNNAPPPTTSGIATISCRPAGSTDGGVTPAAQSSANAQAAVTFGQITVQNYADRISKAVMGSFGLMAGGRPQSEASVARARVDDLKQQERIQAEELAELLSTGATSPASNTTSITYLEQALAATRRTLALAQSAVPDGRLDGSTDSPGLATPRKAEASSRMVTIGGPQASAAPSGIKLDAQDLIAMCAAVGDSNDACDGFGSRWNAWTEARVIGGSDSLTRARALGFIASGGIDYKFQPWLAAGLTLGVENFESQFSTPGVRLGTLGFSAIPYLGFRLSETVYASAFAGVSTINYSTNPAAGVSASFNATRLFLGTSVIGNWNYGAWRFQPTLMGTFGTESQNGYTDTLGNSIGGQSASFGRIVLSPEVGYGFSSVEHGWTLEPFVLARIGVDFASSTVAVTNGQSVIVRPGTLAFGGLGGGVAMKLQNGGYMRAQGSYDSIGVSGLSLWSAVLRAGITF